MRLFKKDNGYYGKHVNVTYSVGEPIEVLVDDEWELYEVKEDDSGDVYFEPYGFRLNLNWIRKITDYRYRQTGETLAAAMEQSKRDIQDKRDIINHRREKEDIESIKAKIVQLNLLRSKLASPGHTGDKV